MDCDDMPGRLKEICNGTARKSNGEFFTEDERQAIMAKRLATGDGVSGKPATFVPVKNSGCGRCGKKK